MKVNVQPLDAQAAGELELNAAVFGVAPRTDILHRVVTWQLEKRRAPARAPPSVTAHQLLVVAPADDGERI